MITFLLMLITGMLSYLLGWCNCHSMLEKEARKALLLRLNGQWFRLTPVDVK